jgi:hypothetical protein
MSGKCFLSKANRLIQIAEADKIIKLHSNTDEATQMIPDLTTARIAMMKIVVNIKLICREIRVLLIAFNNKKADQA